MNEEIKQRILKIAELANRGIGGEKENAKRFLDKMLKKYDTTLDEIKGLQPYTFKYSSKLDAWLFGQILDFFAPNVRRELNREGKRSFSVKMKYLDWVAVDCAYGYFRPHMAAQWRKFSKSELKKKRTAKTKNARRAELYRVFYNKYILKSGIYFENQVKYARPENDQEAWDNIRASQEIEGGTYRTQIHQEQMKIEY